MAATLVNLAGFSFAFATPETGVNIEDVNDDIERKKLLVPNHTGETIGKVFWDIMQKIQISGEFNGASGIAAAVPGVAITVANLLNGNGVTTGGVYTEKLSIKRNREKLKSASLDAERHPLVP